MKEDAPELSRNQTMFIYSCIRIALAWLAEVGGSREGTARRAVGYVIESVLNNQIFRRSYFLLYFTFTVGCGRKL